MDAHKRFFVKTIISLTSLLLFTFSISATSGCYTLACTQSFYGTISISNENVINVIFNLTRRHCKLDTYKYGMYGIWAARYFDTQKHHLSVILGPEPHINNNFALL